MKALFSAAAIVLTLWLFIPYIRSIRSGQTRPHVFSWVIWGLGTLIVCFAQLAGGAGFGAWAIGISGLITIYIAWLAWWKRADTVITKTDWVFLVVALSALPLWFFTANPLWAVVILTLVDLLGFGPTLRKAYIEPHRESAAFFAGAALRNLLVVLAVETFSLTTVLFPATVGLACVAVALLLVGRRRQLARR